MSEDSAPSSSLEQGATQLVGEVISPQAERWEADRFMPRHALERAADLGLCGLFVPPELGGGGLGAVEAGRILATIAAADFGFAFSLVCHNNLAGAIGARGTATQQERHLPALISGRQVGAFLLTEPSAGSDSASIATTATPTGSGMWRIDGEKAWVTNGSEADLMNVYVQTEPGSGPRGIAAFLVEAEQPGVNRGDPYHMLGAHSTGTASFRFDGVEVGADQLFIDPGQAFGAAMSAIDLARVMVATMSAAIVEHCLGLAVERMSQRQAFGRPLADQQGLRWMLADVATDLRASKALTDQASAMLDRVGPGPGDLARAEATVAAAHAKKFATRLATRAITDCMQVLGADGFRQDYPVARHLAAAKMTHYLDGTTEIQNLVIARSMFG